MGLCFYLSVIWNVKREMMASDDSGKWPGLIDTDHRVGVDLLFYLDY